MSALAIMLSKGTGTGMRYEAFMAVMFQVKVFWVVMPCSTVVGH
jgi:hypothetical protein